MSWKYLRKNTVSEERVFSLIRRPIITEKSTLGGQNNQYTFRVASNASKLEVKKAVAEVFSVEVKSVNTLSIKGKVKRFKGIKGVRSQWKKAIVTLSEGQSIDIATGV